MQKMEDRDIFCLLSSKWEFFPSLLSYFPGHIPLSAYSKTLSY